MFHRRLALIVFCVMIGSLARAQTESPTFSVGQMLGRTFYNKGASAKFDTVSWDAIQKVYLGPAVPGWKNPVAACSLFQAKKKSAHLVKGVSAMSLAILKDLGYDVIALTQWNAAAKDQVAYSRHNEYEKRDYRTDFGWEIIERVDIGSKPDKINPDYKLEVVFKAAGKAHLRGKEMVEEVNAQIMGTSEGLVIEYQGGGGEDQNVLRKIYRVYVITNAGKKSSDIVTEIEGLMDKLKLDMSYKPPDVKEVSCRK